MATLTIQKVECPWVFFHKAEVWSAKKINSRSGGTYVASVRLGYGRLVVAYLSEGL